MTRRRSSAAPAAPREKNGSRLPLSEKDFAEQVVDLARLCQWRVYRTYDSRRSPAGFPDLVCVKGPRLLFVELKADIGRVTEEQAAWLLELQSVQYATAYGDQHVVSVHLWRPSAWSEIERVLTTGRAA